MTHPEVEKLIKTASANAPTMPEFLPENVKRETALGNFMAMRIGLPTFLQTLKATSYTGQIIVDEVADFDQVLEELNWRRPETERLIANTTRRFEMGRAEGLPTRLGVQLAKYHIDGVGPQYLFVYQVFAHIEFPENMKDDQARKFLQEAFFGRGIPSQNDK